MPLIVLILSIAIFGVLVGGKFFNAFSLTLIIQQVAIVGIVGAAQTLVILTAGIDLSVGAIMVLSSVVMGQFTFRYGIPVPVVDPVRPCLRHPLRLHQRLAGGRHEAAALHRDAGHLAIFMAIEASSIRATRRSASQDIEAQAPLLQVFGSQIQHRRRRVHAWRHLHDPARGRCSGTCSTTPPGAGMSMPWATTRTRPSLSGIRSKRMLIAVYTLAGLICGLAGWVLDRPHRLGLADLRRHSPTSSRSPPW